MFSNYSHNLCFTVVRGVNSDTLQSDYRGETMTPGPALAESGSTRGPLSAVE